MNELTQHRRRGDRRTVPLTGMAAIAAALALVIVGAAGAIDRHSRASAAASSTAAPYRAELQAALDDLRNLGMVGAQGQVSVGGHDTVATSGVADRSAGTPMPVDGHFRIGSTTKTFVSVVVLQLVGEGRLSLDDTVERWLPGVVSGNGNDGSRITVRQLLQHTSGIYDYVTDLPLLASADGYREHRFDHVEPAELVALAMRHAPGFAPGTRWDYSNTNYILAGMIIEKVTGQPWSTQVQARILDPLRLRDTSYPADQSSLPWPRARAYKQFDAGGPLVDVSAFDPTAAGAAGGLVSTTADLSRFWQALQRGELLRPQESSQLHQTVLADSYQEFRPGLRYGLGIFWLPNQCGGYWAHPGDVLGTTTVNGITTSGDRSVVVYRTTALADPAPGAALDNRVFRLLDDVICG